jgi:Protein of unknown function (DUF2934)
MGRILHGTALDGRWLPCAQGLEIIHKDIDDRPGGGRRGRRGLIRGGAWLISTARRFHMSKGDQSQTTNPDAIARRAYELYLQRGSEAGHETEDWLQAEAELSVREEAASGDASDAAHVHSSSSSSSDSSPDPSATPAPEPTGDSAAAQTSKGNTGKRPVRQPQSH